MNAEDIKITARPTIDPDICRFEIDRPLCAGRTVNCRNRDMAKGSPLLDALFAIDGVREVLISDNIITVARSSREEWPTLGKKIGTAIRNIVSSGIVAVPADWEIQGPSENQIFREVRELFAARVNPGVATHGGHVELVDVKGTRVYLRMSGGCQGCGAANITLKQGIERAIRSRVPEVTEIIDVTDHSAGRNPYYGGKGMRFQDGN